MFNKTKARRFMFFSLGVSISLTILYFLQKWFGNGN